MYLMMQLLRVKESQDTGVIDCPSDGPQSYSGLFSLSGALPSRRPIELARRRLTRLNDTAAVPETCSGPIGRNRRRPFMRLNARDRLPDVRRVGGRERGLRAICSIAPSHSDNKSVSAAFSTGRRNKV